MRCQVIPSSRNTSINAKMAGPAARKGMYAFPFKSNGFTIHGRLAKGPSSNKFGQSSGQFDVQESSQHVYVGAKELGTFSVSSLISGNTNFAITVMRAIDKTTPKSVMAFRAVWLGPKEENFAFRSMKANCTVPMHIIND